MDSPFYEFIRRRTNPATGQPFWHKVDVENAAGLKPGYLSIYLNGQSSPQNMTTKIQSRVTRVLNCNDDELTAVILAEQAYRKAGRRKKTGSSVPSGPVPA